MGNGMMGLGKLCQDRCSSFPKYECTGCVEEHLRLLVSAGGGSGLGFLPLAGLLLLAA